MKKLPKRIIRLDDGMEFLLNEGKETYSVHLGIPHLDLVYLMDVDSGLKHEYTFECLMCNPQTKGQFKISDGTEDIQSMKKKWFDEMNALTMKNRGHG